MRRVLDASTVDFPLARLRGRDGTAAVGAAGPARTLPHVAAPQLCEHAER